MLTDPVPLLQSLIRCDSVTPADNGAMDVLQAALTQLGFTCHRINSATGGPEITNLYARLGEQSPNLCFAGHTDVVPPGAGWTTDAFGGAIINDRIYGRGAVDMKGGIAAFVAATARHLKNKPLSGSISLLITGDEEGPAIDGTKKVLEWMRARGETMDQCLVGEPTNPSYLGEMMKIGRRGSLNCKLKVFGTQGHAAYPQLANNPIPILLDILARLTAKPLDHGSEHFQPSTLTITTVDVGNTATNVIPATAQAGFNIRFNDLFTGPKLEQWIRDVVAQSEADVDIKIEISGESFLTSPGLLSDAVADAAEAVTGKRPELSTTGGTSDARFIKDHCPVLEFGLISQTMHKLDEHVSLKDLEDLTQIYERVIDRVLSA